MAELKTKPTDRNVFEVLERIEDETKRRDALTLVDLMREATGAEPRLWGEAMVGFGTYHYHYASGREGDWPPLAFAARKQNLTLYFCTGLEAHADLLGQLGRHSTGKGCLYIKKLADVDLDILRALLRRSLEGVARTD